jgi:predicted nucleic-acid-binding Zn-ribbon protein
MTKCSQCGGTEFDKGTIYGTFTIKYKSENNKRININTDAYLCQNCGHIELYMSKKKQSKK